MSDSRGTKFDQFQELPGDVRALIIGLSATDPKAFSVLLSTSKDVANRVMESLRNPFVLLRLLCTSSEEEKVKLVHLHFSPDSANYRAIENAAFGKGDLAVLKNLPTLYQEASIICFALIMNEKQSEAVPHDMVMSALESLKAFAVNNNQSISWLDAIEKNLIARNEFIAKKRNQLNASEGDPVVPPIYINLSGVDLIKRYCLNMDLRTFNLRDTDLLNTELKFANLEKAILINANLTGATYDHTNLDDVIAENAIFETKKIFLTTFKRAKLCEGNFSNTEFDRVDFSYADLRKANFTNAKFDHYFSTDFSKANLENANFYKAIFGHGNFSDEHGNHLGVKGCDLSGVNFKKANFCEANLGSADISRSDFSETDLSGTDLIWVQAQSTNLRGANLKGANMRGSNFNGADLTCANLQFVLLDGVDFRNAILEKTTFIPNAAYAHPDHMVSTLDWFDKLNFEYREGEENREIIRKAVYNDFCAHSKDPALIKVAESHPYFRGMKFVLAVEELKKTKTTFISSITNLFKGKPAESSSQNKDKEPEKKGPQ